MPLTFGLVANNNLSIYFIEYIFVDYIKKGLDPVSYAVQFIVRIIYTLEKCGI